MNKVSSLIYKAKHGIWVIPFTLILCSVIIFYTLSFFELRSEVLELLYEQGWHGILGQSAYALIGVAINVVVTIFALSLSLTMIVLTLASAQLGPRIMDHFLASKTTQVVIGIYLSSILILMLLNAQVDATTPQDQMPLTLIFYGYVLTLCSPVLMVIFVQHLISSIIPDNVAKQLSKELCRAAENYVDLNSDEKTRVSLTKEKTEHMITASLSGYFSAVNQKKLMACLTKHNLSIAFHHVLGDYVLEEAKIATLYTHKTKISTELSDTIHSSIEITPELPVTNEVEFYLRKLVEIALRALSPGINDPYTAHACLNYMFSSLQSIALSEQLPFEVYADEEGVGRILLPIFTVERMYDLALNEIQEACLGKTTSQLHMLSLISTALNSPLNTRTRKHLMAHGREIIAETSMKTTYKIQLDKLSLYKEKFETLAQNA